MKTSTIIKIILIFIIIIASAYIFYFIGQIVEAEQESNLLNEIKIDTKNNIIVSNLEKKVDTEITERMLQVQELQKQNKEIVGWIEIENTNISYPVLQGTDNEYYINHNYKHKKTSKGSIFLNKDYDWNLPSTNLIIYGHNMKNGEMFQDLLNYSSEEYYKEHSIIRFTTVQEDSYYEIFSVFKSRVYYKSEENVFRYYNFINANNEEDYNQFVQNAQDSSLYNTGITAKYNEQLITLITCSYHVEDGRFVVVGRKK